MTAHITDITLADLRGMNFAPKAEAEGLFRALRFAEHTDTASTPGGARIVSIEGRLYRVSPKALRALAERFDGTRNGKVAKAALRTLAAKQLR